MPYELTFSKPLTVPDPEIYFNECCWGGDMVVDKLLPAVRRQFEAVQTNQEDWGWFIWFKKGQLSLAIDIVCDDPRTGSFRIHLTSRKKRMFLATQVVDLPELEELKELVAMELERWGARCEVLRLDADYNPLEPPSGRRDLR